MTERPRLYYFIAPPTTGRDPLLADLVDSTFDPEEPVILLEEPGDPLAPEIRSSLKGRPGTVIVPWRFDAATHRFTTEALNPGAGTGEETLLALPDGAGPLVDQLEGLQGFLRRMDFRLARIVCLLDCGLAAEDDQALAFYKACIHFSDVILLTNRKAAGNAWVQQLLSRYEKEHLPARLILMKKGKVENPAEVMDPTARRLSQLFEEDYPGADGRPAWAAGLPDDVIIEDEAGEPLDEDDDDTPDVDPYLERRHEGGPRRLPLPDIRAVLQRAGRLPDG
ncbi:MAG: hypothetical protein ACFE0O_05135 [Opitutales bacterium]